MTERSDAPRPISSYAAVKQLVATLCKKPVSLMHPDGTFVPYRWWRKFWFRLTGERFPAHTTCLEPRGHSGPCLDAIVMRQTVGSTPKDAP